MYENMIGASVENLESSMLHLENHEQSATSSKSQTYVDAIYPGQLFRAALIPINVLTV